MVKAIHAYVPEDKKAEVMETLDGFTTSIINVVTDRIWSSGEAHVLAYSRHPPPPIHRSP